VFCQCALHCTALHCTALHCKQPGPEQPANLHLHSRQTCLQGSIKVGTLGTAFLDNLNIFRQSVTETATKSDHNLVKLDNIIVLI
jgi:hypothetical protein